MVTIVVLHAKEDVTCAEQIHLGLESQGYHIWREPRSLSLNDIIYPEALENAILSSVGIVLIWGINAAQSVEVKRSILLAQRLKKPVYPILLDSTDLPTIPVTISPLTSQTSCTDMVAQLVPQLPAPQSTDTLITLTEKAIHNHIYVRKEAINLAAEMMLRGEQREKVLAVLEYLAEKDPITSVRDKAMEVLSTKATKTVLPAHSDEWKFDVRCPNGHITYFDKRDVCASKKRIVRGDPASKKAELDELSLQCGQCGEEMIVNIDCRGYK